jgi:hypothetical protein
MQFMPDFRNKKRVNTKQQGRQKMKVKLTARVVVAAVLLIVFAIVFIWQLQRPESSTAGRQPVVPVRVINPAYVTDMSLPQPVITHAAFDPNVIQYRLPADGNK